MSWNVHPRILWQGALLALAVGAISCGGSSSHKNNLPIPSSGANVQTVVVNGGPENNYANGIFTSLTVCVPSTSSCQTINNVLVDTGSYGLRLLSSTGGGALTLSLPTQNGTHGNPMGECAEFVSGFTWGRVVTADVKIASEQASGVPVQVIDQTFAAVPTSCSGAGIPEQDTIQKLGAEGILGVGPFVQDCGGACTQSGSTNPGVYYECASTSCQAAVEPIAQQVSNPVGLFATDNNGVILELPALSSPAPTVDGSLIFGIGTESNNGLNDASVYPMNASAEFSTSYSGHNYPGFVDSGSNGLFFPNAQPSSVPPCPSPNNSFYCPASTANLSATISSPGGPSTPINFSVSNADSLFSSSGNFAFPTLAGPDPGTFDWGLPFFFGRNVYTAIDAHSTPGGQGPYWAF